MGQRLSVEKDEYIRQMSGIPVCEPLTFLGNAIELGKPWDGPMVPTPVVWPSTHRVMKMKPRSQGMTTWRPPCETKARYSCKADAISVAAGAMKRKRNRPKMLRAYECPHCSGWHLTKKPLKNDA
jgi:hypothetical protein